MHTKDPVINKRCHWEAVENVYEEFPQFNIVSALAFIIKSIDAVDRRAFMVSSQQEKIARVLDFVCQQQADDLQRVFPSVHIVSQKQII